MVWLVGLVGWHSFSFCVVTMVMRMPRMDAGAVGGISVGMGWRGLYLCQHHHHHHHHLSVIFAIVALVGLPGMRSAVFDCFVHHQSHHSVVLCILANNGRSEHMCVGDEGL
ncbi:uncharacterized protein J3D65DRAFT_622669 [Phyllosticta citribraziliensis]|uniref:Secreted protein n=1 Tax=Phyllosticta citribraziliensis TaxID=989973 RepID=A0ABR1LTY3_9PEZI